MSDKIFGFRPRGSTDIFYSPDRDVCKEIPNALVAGAAYAADPRSSINHALEAQMVGGTAFIRGHLELLLTAIEGMRYAPMDVVMGEIKDKLREPVLHAIMEGLGFILMLKFSNYFRIYKAIDVTGGTRYPLNPVDKVYAMSAFDDMVSQARSG